MASHRNQHYLPCSYLRNFSVDGQRGSRKSSIWQIDSKGRRLVRVESQGFGRHFYSRDRAVEVEGLFQTGERFYAGLSRKFWDQQGPRTKHEHFGLLLMMLDLHIRNAIYAKAKRDNYDEYLNMASTVKYRILWRRPEIPSGDEAIAEEAQKHWSMRVLRVGAGRSFIASDNPSMLFHLGDSKSLVNMVLTPLTPSTYGVAVDNRELDITATSTSKTDEGKLTISQIENCVKCVYAERDLTDEEWLGFLTIFGQRAERSSVEGPGAWGMNYFQPPSGRGFDFVRLRSLH
jgi:hypothetical protein